MPTMSLLLTGMLIVLTTPMALGQWSSTPTWSDEFNGSSVNTADWTAKVGGPGGNCCGGTEQYFRNENVTVSGGSLHIRASRESYGGFNYTSGAIESIGKRMIPAYTDYRLEFRAKLPSGYWLWPALWGFEAGYMSGLELDTMETWGVQPTSVWQTLHDWTLAADTIKQCLAVAGVDLSQGYHIYAWEVINGQHKMYLDSTLTCQTTYRQPQQPVDMKINISIGCNYGCSVGMPPADPAQDPNTYPQYLDVDYVRLYTTTGPDTTPPASPTGLKVQ